MNTLFHSEAISGAAWLRAAAAGALIFAVVGLEKRWPLGRDKQLLATEVSA